MIAGLARGRYRARLAQSAADLAAAQVLRHRAFITQAGLPPREGGLDRDAIDPLCQHLLVEDVVTGRLAGTCRLMILPSGAAVGRSYAAQFYDLSRLAAFPGRLAEVGRFCIEAGPGDADVLRLAWGAITQCVDAADVRFLFGCSSFPGTDAAAFVAAFAFLAAGHLAPQSWLPGIRAPEVVRFAAMPPGPSEPRAGLAALPPLLRSYLALGGRVSDHAVIDRELQTLHVFTGVDIAQVPPARARALRTLAGEGALAPSGLTV